MDDIINEISNSQVNLYFDGYQQFFKFEVSDSANDITDVNNDFKLYLKLVTGAQLIPYLSTLKKTKSIVVGLPHSLGSYVLYHSQY